MIDTNTRRAAEAQAIVERLRAIRIDEAAAGLDAGLRLRQVRDEHLVSALNERTLASALAAKAPAIDRASARTLLEVADAFYDADLVAVLPIGLARLAIVAGAPIADRATILSSADMLPPRELARMVQDARERLAASSLRAGARTPTSIDPFASRTPRTEDPRTESERATIALDALARAKAAWDDIGTSAFEAARLMARLRDENLYSALGDGDPQSVAEQVLDLSPSDLTRAYALADRGALVLPDVRRRVGIRAIRAICAVDDDARRAALLRQVTDDASLAGDLVVALARAPRAARPDVVAATGGAHLVDDPDALIPFDMLFCPDPDASAPAFPDTTPDLVVEQILYRTTKPGASVCDLMAGIGTVARIGTRLGRIVTSVDLISPALAPGVEVGDGRSFSSPASPFDLVIVHPPTVGETHYTERFGGQALAGDLSNYDADGYARALTEMIENAARLTVTGGRLAVICRPSRWRGRFLDWPARVAAMAQAAGFRPTDKITAVLGIEARREAGRREGFLAARDSRTVIVSWTVLLFERPTRRGAAHG